jgi:ribulose-phosphate 3-epimerase
MNLKKNIIPAVIAKNQDELEDRIKRVVDFFDIIQLDFMDGKFVPNNSIDFDFKLPKTKCKFESHLMINNPQNWIENNALKVDTILVHYESINDSMKIINQVKDQNKKVGFVLNPETPISKIENYLDQLDQVLIMTVNPGFYGSPFLPEMIKKISDLRKIKPDLDIEVDGGIVPDTIGLVNRAGANMFVSGSYIVKSKNVEESIFNLKKVID